MYDFYEWARQAAHEHIAEFVNKPQDIKLAFLTLASDYLAECEPFAFPESPYHDDNGEFSDADFIIHMWDLFSWFDESEAREYWDTPDDVKGEEFWQEAYSACNTHNSFVYSDNKSIIAWLDI